MIRLLFIILALMILVACKSDGGGAVTAQHSMPATETGAFKKALTGVGFEINTSAESAVDTNAFSHVEHAYLYLEQQKMKHGLNDPRQQLTLKREHVDVMKRRHVKFQQVHKGVPVWGREIIVHFNDNDSVYGTSGEILTGIKLSNTQPAITKNEAGNMVMKSSQWGSQSWQIKSIELYVVNQDGKDYLAYQLNMTKQLLREFVFMNANDGNIFHRISGVHTTY